MGTWSHARNTRKVINLDHDGDRKIMCGWDECDRDGYDNNRVQVNYGTTGNPHILKFVFCTERHRQYFINSHLKYGNLPPGYARSIL